MVNKPKSNLNMLKRDLSLWEENIHLDLALIVNVYAIKEQVLSTTADIALARILKVIEVNIEVI